MIIEKKKYVVEELLQPELLNKTSNFYKLKNNYKIKKGFIIPGGSNLLEWNGYSFGLNINGEVSLVIPIIEEYKQEQNYNYILCIPAGYLIKINLSH